MVGGDLTTGLNHSASLIQVPIVHELLQRFAQLIGGCFVVDYDLSGQLLARYLARDHEGAILILRNHGYLHGVWSAAVRPHPGLARCVVRGATFRSRVQVFRKAVWRQVIKVCSQECDNWVVIVSFERNGAVRPVARVKGDLLCVFIYGHDSPRYRIVRAG